MRQVDDAELKRRFARFGAVSGVKACLKGGYGFVQFAEHAAAVAAIVEMNGRQLGGKTLKCAWGRHQNRAAQAPAPASLPPPPLPIHPVAAQGLLRLGMLGAPVGGAAAPTSTGFLGPAVAGVQVLPIHMEVCRFSCTSVCCRPPALHVCGLHVLAGCKERVCGSCCF